MPKLVRMSSILTKFLLCQLDNLLKENRVLTCNYSNDFSLVAQKYFNHIFKVVTQTD